jgi:hypothetical protein
LGLAIVSGRVHSEVAWFRVFVLNFWKCLDWDLFSSFTFVPGNKVVVVDLPGASSAFALGAYV